MANSPSSTNDSPTGSGGRSSWTWLLPALAFVAGVALGAVVVAVGASGDDDVPEVSASASPGAEATPTTSDDVDADASGDAVVRVPAPCLDAADGAEQAARQVDDVVAAVREFDARRLQELVDEFQQLQPEVQRLADQCRDAAGQRVSDGTLVTPVPVPSSS